MDYQSLLGINAPLADYLFQSLFDGEYDWKSANADNKASAMDLLQVLSTEEIRSKIDKEGAVNMLLRIIRLSDALDTERFEPEMDLSYLNACGTDENKRVEVILTHYSRKSALKRMEKNYDAAAKL